MTPLDKSEELIEQLGVWNAIYTVDCILKVIKEYPNNSEDIKDWKQVREEIVIRLNRL